MRTVFAAGWLVACGGGGGAPGDTPRAFVAGDGATFGAVVTDGITALAYRCDGDAAGASHASWFSGDAAEGDFTLSGKTDELTVELGEAEATLTLSDGTSVVAEEVDPDAEDEGLFRAEGEADGGPFVVGWILAPGGDQRGAIGLSTSGVLFGVVPLEPGERQTTVSVEGKDVSVAVANAVTLLGT